MEIFYQVVQAQSFSKAAEHLGVSKSFVSKRMSKLEESLNVRLMNRSTRSLSLTQAGEVFYRQCVKVVTEAELAFDLLQELQGTPSGVLRVSIPPAFAVYALTPMLAHFAKRYPEIKLEVELESELVDVIAGSYDVVLRSAKLEDSSLIVQTIRTFDMVICASPKYIASHPVLQKPQDLSEHYCALYNKTNTLHFAGKDARHQVYLQGNFSSNHTGLIKNMALEDVCIAVLSEFMVQEELANGSLVQCLPSYQLPKASIYALYPEKKLMLPKVTAFLDELKKWGQTLAG